MTGMNHKEFPSLVATVIQDPAKEPKHGDRILFQSVRLRSSDPKDTRAYVEPYAFQGVLLGCSFSDDESHDTLGSAIMVAPGVALGAKHVFEPQMEHMLSDGRIPTCTAITEEGLHLWSVHKINLIPDTDLAILGLQRVSEYPQDRTFRHASISTRLPRIGERLHIAGFRQVTSEKTEEDGNNCYHTYGDTIVCSGVITERYPLGRDKANIPWPVLEVNCPTWGGMSGGPVFDEHGLLIGILCSSINYPPHEHEGTTYVSLLWPALSQTYEGGWPTALFPNPTTLLELPHNLCDIDRREAVSYQLNAETGRLLTTYHAWEA